MSFTQDHLVGRVDFPAFYASEGVVFRGKRALCPFHDDKHPSLDIDSRTGLYICRSCDAGGDPVTFLEKRRGLTSAEAIAELKRRYNLNGGPPPPASRTTPYDLFNAKGELVALHVRTDHADGSKRFKWTRPDGSPGLGGIPLADLPLYGSERLAGQLTDIVLVVEGEKAADALISRGILAVGTVTGANASPGAAALEPLRGREVVFWPDHDEVGRKHMNRIGEKLAGVAASVRVLSWGERKGDDAHDFFARGGSTEQLDRMLEEAPDYEPASETPQPADEPSEPAPLPADWIRPGVGLAARPAPMARVSLAAVFPTLHENTRGGLPTGCVVSIQGAPDSAKTGVAQTIADAAERQGWPVVHLSNDNGREPAEIRYGQLMGFDRTKLEEGDPDELARFTAAFTERRIFMPDPDRCDENLEPINTLANVIEKAKGLFPGGRVFLLVDSVQTVIPDAGKYESPRLRVIATMKLLRRAANIPRWIVVDTSQINREAFKNRKESKNTDPLAAGSESSSIEFGSDLMLYLSTTETGICARITKNKPGAGRRLTFPIAWDKDRARASEPDTDSFAAEALKLAEQERKKLWSKLDAILAAEPGLSTQRVQQKARPRREADVTDALEGMAAASPPRAIVMKKGNGKYWYPPEHSARELA
jgi:hypothetical protein